jgi:hypothetical protein
MSMEIIVGLPHLNRGPILARAAELRAPALISANCLSVWSRRNGWPDWGGWRLDKLENAQGLPSLCLDSAGFVATALYGGFPWSVGQYVALAAAFPFRWWASIDYCTEAEIAGDREEVLDRISRTIRANLDCWRAGEEAGIDGTFLPVIQGRTPTDYERCLDGISACIHRGRSIGVGSMCRRELHGPEGLVAIVDYLDRLLPAGIRLHLFGVKGTVIPFLLPFRHRIASLDSQAYGVTARRDAYRRRIPKTDRLVADHLERWFRVQHRRRRGRARSLPMQIEPVPASEPSDRWEAAIAIARQEIRELIETGDLDHDEITLPWVEQWAAEIYRDRT